MMTYPKYIWKVCDLRRSARRNGNGSNWVRTNLFLFMFWLLSHVTHLVINLTRVELDFGLLGCVIL
jgi:hypothetical protein